MEKTKVKHKKYVIYKVSLHGFKGNINQAKIIQEELENFIKTKHPEIEKDFTGYIETELIESAGMADEN